MMMTILTILAALVGTAHVGPTAGGASGHVAPLPAAQTTIYEGAGVWNGRGFDRRDLAVRNGRFVRLARSRPGVRTVDLRGQFVVPAYGNAHVHITHPQETESRASLRNGVFYL